MKKGTVIQANNTSEGGIKSRGTIQLANNRWLPEMHSKLSFHCQMSQIRKCGLWEMGGVIPYEV